MNNKYPLIVGSILLLFATASLADSFSSASLLAEIERSGPEKVVSKYFGKPEWRTILNGIGTAEESWLKVYVELRKGSDGEAGEDLSTALWDVALPRAPFKVFAIERDHSCQFTFEANCPPGGIDSYLTRLEKALGKASTPEQHKMRSRCLAGIEQTRATFKNPKAYCAQ